VGLVDEPAPVADSEDDALAAMLRRRRTIGLTALLTVLGLALALAVTAWYFASGPGAYTATPKVAGLGVTAAQDALARQGLRSSQQDVFDATVASGVVVGTDPAAGQDVRKDGTVVLKVSKGPEFVKVPALVGQQESAARTALTTAHLVQGTRTEQYSDEPRGEVLAIKPEAGQQARNGSAVALTVSKGPRPVQVPDLVGRSRGEAERILDDLRLGVLYGPSRNDDSPAGTVIEQKPRNTTLVPGQGQVTLVLSKGPVLVPVPNVVGKQFAEAENLLQQAGFTVERRSVFGGFFGTVRFQTPAAGRMAPKGSTVIVTLV
jgi:serine/threonine-protein kinase